MGTTIFKISIVLTTIILYSCERYDKSVTIPFESQTSIKSSDKIIRTWVYVCDNLFVRCFVDIKSDSTFNYESGGCLGTCYTSGKWTLKGDLLVLNSFDKYAPKTAAMISAPVEPIEKISKTNKSYDTSNLKNFTISIEPSVLSASFIPCNLNLDSTTTFFKDRLFILEKDTLFELTGHIGTRNGSKFCPSKNY